jgi:hypothetical protein
MAILAADLMRHVIAPVLESCPLRAVDTAAARVLLLATACHESDCGSRLAQQGGPALGIYQMEPKTHDDVWRRSSLAMQAWLRSYCCGLSRDPNSKLLAGDLLYATALARANYWLAAAGLPDARDMAGMAMYWWRYWCRGCKGTPEQFIAAWQRHHGDSAFKLITMMQ